MYHLSEKFQFDLKLLIKTMKYAAIANTITQTKPSSTAIIAASTTLTTEKTPLIPQAQGISEPLVVEIIFKPSGNGIPIKNAVGVINRNDKIIFAVRLNPIVVFNHPERNSV